MYLLGATLFDKVNANAATRLSRRFVPSRMTETRRSRGKIGSADIPKAIARSLQAMVPLTWDHTVENQRYFRVTDDYCAVDYSSVCCVKIS